MADQSAPAGQSAENLPERPKEGAAAAPEGEKGPSKAALKKAQKEKEKACPSDLDLAIFPIALPHGH